MVFENPLDAKINRRFRFVFMGLASNKFSEYVRDSNCIYGVISLLLVCY